MNKSVMMLHLARACQRQFVRPASSDVIASKNEKLRALQKHFQIDSGVPVYLRKGFSDKVLFQLTVLLTGIGLGLSGQLMWKLTFKD